MSTSASAQSIGNGLRLAPVFLLIMAWVIVVMAVIVVVVVVVIIVVLTTIVAVSVGTGKEHEAIVKTGAASVVNQGRQKDSVSHAVQSRSRICWDENIVISLYVCSIICLEYDR